MIKNKLINFSVKWLILFGVWLVYFSFGLSISGLAPIVTMILKDLDMTYTQMGSVLGAWQLIYIFSSVPCGLFVDRIGPSKALLLASVIMSVSGFLRSFSEDFTSLFIAVSIFGIGGPIVSSGAPKLIALWFSGKERGFAMGVYITGPALASLITLSMTHPLFLPMFDGNWRAVIQLWSTITLLIGLLWLGISYNREAPKLENKAAKQNKETHLTQIKSIICNVPVQIMLLMAIGIFMFNHGLNNWLPELLRSKGMDDNLAGYWASIPTIIGIFGSLLIPRFATPERRFLMLPGLIILAGVATIFLVSPEGPLLFFALVVQGIARSSLMTIAILTLVELPGIGKKRAGTASGLFFSAAELGGVSGPLMLGIFFDIFEGFNAGLHMLTLIMLCLLIGSLYLKKKSKNLTQKKL